MNSNTDTWQKGVLFQEEVYIISNKPGEIPCPLWSPRGFEGVLQSRDTSLRNTVSISTALKNATD